MKKPRLAYRLLLQYDTLMISIDLAQQLKENGLTWQPEQHDRFAVLGSSLENQTFIINEMAVLIELWRGVPVVTFHGTPEWALDYVMVADTVWLPSESQLRNMLEERLLGEPEPKMRLVSTDDGYRCDMQRCGEQHSFEAFGGADAYGLALLYILKSNKKE